MKPNIYNFFKFLNQEEQRPIPFKAKLIYAPETLTPQELNVEGDLDLEDCKNLTSLPEGLTVVEGDLNLANCTSLKELPKGLTVEGDLYLRNTLITSLPKDLKAERSLDLEDCKNLTSLPEGLTVVEGDLNLANCTSFKELPKGLTVEGLLDLRNTPITSLPKGLTVGGNLYLGGTFLTDQTDKQIRDMIGPNGYIKGKIYR